MQERIVLLDHRAPEAIKTRLTNLGINIIFVGSCGSLPWQICAHPDMVYHRVSEKLSYVAPEFYADALRAFNSYESILKNRVLEKGDTVLGNTYPKDVPYNLLRIGNRIFGNLSAADKGLLRAIEKEGAELVDVKQGYAKCSAAVVSTNGVITADKGLLKKFDQYGIDTLYIEPGGISLPGHEYGFIGGASGLLDNNFFLTGRFEKDDINIKIEEFVRSKGSRMLFLSDEKIMDIGSIIEA